MKGFAHKQAGLSVFLDYRKCLASASKEAKRDIIYTYGYSYFIGPSSVTGAAVKGSFDKSFTAHPGSKTGTRCVCAYLTSGKSVVRTKAFKSKTYQVTK